MIRRIFIATGLALLLAPAVALAVPQEPPVSQTISQLMLPVSPTTRGDTLLSWEPGPVSCAGGTVAAVDWVAPHSAFVPKRLRPLPVTIGFAVDAAGRPVTIRALEGGYVQGKVKAAFDPAKNTISISSDNLPLGQSTRDLMPSLRASLFAPGAPRKDCRVTYTPRFADAADLSREQLAPLVAVPGMRFTAAQYDRFGGSDCHSVGVPALAQQAYPDWRQVEARDGARKWTWIGFDVDADGKPVNVAVLASSGDDNLDAEARRAVSENRFREGNRKGCVSTFWRNPKTIPAPPSPELSSFSGYRSCRGLKGWARRPAPRFPPSYNQRAIEGWAVLSFDIAADGAIQNIAVLAAEPTEEFGEAGEAVLRTGRFEQGGEVHTRCVERVVFKLDETRQEAAPGS